MVNTADAAPPMTAAPGGGWRYDGTRAMAAVTVAMTTMPIAAARIGDLDRVADAIALGLGHRHPTARAST